MNAKLQWLRNKMSSLDLQGLIISNPINIKYLTNIDAEGVLLLTRKENIYSYCSYWCGLCQWIWLSPVDANQFTNDLARYSRIGSFGNQ